MFSTFDPNPQLLTVVHWTCQAATLAKFHPNPAAEKSDFTSQLDNYFTTTLINIPEKPKEGINGILYLCFCFLLRDIIDDIWPFLSDAFRPSFWSSEGGI